MIEIGQIIKAQGIKGELKVLPLTFDIRRFNKLKEVIVDNTSFIVLKATVRDNFVYVTLQGVSDRTYAETFKDKLIYVNDEEKVKLPKNTYLIKDLIDCEVFIDEKNIGKLTEVNQYGAADVFVVTGEKSYSFPFLNDCVISIDIAAKKILLNAKRFYEIAVEN